MSVNTEFYKVKNVSNHERKQLMNVTSHFNPKLFNDVTLTSESMQCGMKRDGFIKCD
jgi:hypothetical protein